MKKKTRKTWWHWLLLRRRLSIAEYKAKQWKKDACKLLRERQREEIRFKKDAAKTKQQLERILEAFEKRCQKSEDVFTKSEELIERWDSVEEALTSELTICKENIIPTQAMALELYHSMLESSNDIEQQRRAIVNLPTKRTE